MPGVPPTSPNFDIPRWDNGDEANFAAQVNAIVDQIDLAVDSALDTINAAIAALSDAAITGAEELRVVRGRVASDGTINGGTDFTITKTGTGIYSINFVPAFSAAAATVVSPGYGVGNVAVFAHLNGDGNAVIQSLRILTVGNAPANIDAPFQFISIGPR